MKRNKCIIFIILLFITGSMFAFSKKNLDDITENRLQSACMVLDAKGKEIDINEFLDVYGKRTYRIYKGAEGNTAKKKWTFYDDDGSILFCFTYLGNNELVAVSFEGERKVYKSF